MPKYVLLSIPIALALVVGCLAFAVKIFLLDPPTLEEIRNAPLYTGPGGATFDFETWQREWEARNKAGDNVTVKPQDPTPARPDKKLNPMDYRQNKEIARRNAFIVARKCGAYAGMIALVLGYAGLGIYFLRLGRRRPKQSWRNVVRPTAHEPGDDVTPEEDSPYDAPPDQGPDEPDA
ncbi:MAG TPA: hypothetical protein VMZ92_16640 [Planctomycetota bacterium]|nr:hypothetical protein [Planctomycetota bacterium]